MHYKTIFGYIELNVIIVLQMLSNNHKVPQGEKATSSIVNVLFNILRQSYTMNFVFKRLD